MNFKELLEGYEGLLEWEAIIQYNNRLVTQLRCNERYKTNLLVHEDYLEIEHLELKDDGMLYPYRHCYVPFSSICSFQI